MEYRNTQIFRNREFYTKDKKNFKKEVRAMQITATVNLVIMLFFIIYGIMYDVMPPDNESQRNPEVNEGWSYIVETEGEQEEGQITLPYSFTSDGRDCIYIYRTIPEDITSSEIYFESSFICLNPTIYVDGEEIFSYRDQMGIFRPGMFPINKVYVKLPDSCQGSMLTLRLERGVDFKATLISEIAIGSPSELKVYNWIKKGIRNVFPILLFLGSLIMIVVSVIVFRGIKNRKLTAFRIYFITILTYSCWIMFSGVNQIFVNVMPVTFSLLGEMSLFLARAMLCLYMLYFIATCNTLCRGVFWINFFFTISTCYFVGATFYLQSVVFFLISASIAFLYTWNVLIKKTRKIWISDFGMLSISLASVVELVKSWNNHMLVLEHTPMIIGMFIGFAFMILDMIVSASISHRQRHELEERSHRAYTKLVLEHLNTHFLLNSFGVLNGAISVKSEDASVMGMSLARCLRYTVSALQNDELVSASEEFRYIEDFCYMQRQRFGPAVDVAFYIQAEDFLIPRLSVHPFVENAINGIRKVQVEGQIRVSSIASADSYIITVSNTGCGYLENMGEAALGTISAIDDRLRLAVGGQVLYSDMPEEGTAITIMIPRKGEGINEGNSSR